MRCGCVQTNEEVAYGGAPLMQLLSPVGNRLARAYELGLLQAKEGDHFPFSV
jgi:hypothetical protein